MSYGPPPQPGNARVTAAVRFDTCSLASARTHVTAHPVGTPVGRHVWCLPRAPATVELAG